MAGTDFDLNTSVEILERTPLVLETLLSGLADEWILSNEGPETWSPYDVIGHLVHGEKTDWIPRMKIILSENTNKTFEPFDRFAMFSDSRGKSLSELLAQFKELRHQNIKELRETALTENALSLTGMHPALGAVTLRQLLAAWVVHDLGHIAQVARVMAKQYKKEIGPWTEYLTIVNK